MVRFDPGDLPMLAALLADVLDASASLQAKTDQVQRVFVSSQWVGPGADAVADHLREARQHIRASEEHLESTVLLVRKLLESSAAALGGSDWSGSLATASPDPPDFAALSDRPVPRPIRSDSHTTEEIEISIFLSEDDERALGLLRQSLDSLLRNVGFEQVDWGAIERGSIRQRGRAKSSGTKDEVVRRLEKIERALQVNNLDLPQSQANQANAQAVAAITAAHVSVADVVLQLGSLVYVKWTDGDGTAHVVTRTLSVQELVAFEAHPHLLADARAAIGFLRAQPAAPNEVPAPPGVLPPSGESP